MDREQIIREKAYELYEIRVSNKWSGSAEEDWELAEIYFQLVNIFEVEENRKNKKEREGKEQ